MKRPTPRGFTLVEMITVVAVIIILAGLVISVSGLVTQKASRARADAEIKVMTNHLDSFKRDNGTYPRTTDTDKLDPRFDVTPTSSKYLLANLEAYSAITGDYEPTGGPDGKPETNSRVYYTFPRTQLNFTKDSGGNPATIRYIADPWGNAYGYSTAGAEQEATYRAEVRRDPRAARPSDLKGFNPTFDLWSTAGATTLTQKGKWVRNWAE
jgi:prepilin-type N-terminal cleavage/methylation domain-containing protein